MTGIDEKRRYPRAKSPAKIIVAWQTGTQRSISRMDNVALGGFFICTPQSPPVGSIISMLLDLPSGEVRARAFVRRVSPKRGMGVELIHMRPEDRGRLVQLLKPMLGMSTG